MFLISQVVVVDKRNKFEGTVGGWSYMCVCGGRVRVWVLFSLYNKCTQQKLFRLIKPFSSLYVSHLQFLLLPNIGTVKSSIPYLQVVTPAILWDIVSKYCCLPVPLT